MNTNAEEGLFTIAFAGYILSALAFILAVPTHSEKWERRGLIVAVAGFVLHTAAPVLRTIHAGRLPFSNQYEFAITFAWGIVLCFLLMARKYKLQAAGAAVMPIAFLMTGYASMLSKEIKPLMPALQSNWLTIHVGIAVISYGGFALAGGLGVMCLLRSRALQKAPDESGETNLPAADEIRQRIDLYDYLAYRVTAIGLLLLTLVILTGMIWAKSAWGRYWSWDPKETWSLITWIIYALYLHLRLNRGWQGRKAALFAVIGIVCVLFTFIGVNMILPGLHSYM